MRFTPNSENAGRNRVDGQVFGEMQQRDPEFGVTFSREEVARLIGIDPDEIPPDWPIQSVSTGLTFTIVPFRNKATLANLKFAGRFSVLPDGEPRPSASFVCDPDRMWPA